MSINNSLFFIVENYSMLEYIGFYSIHAYLNYLKLGLQETQPLWKFHTSLFMDTCFYLLEKYLQEELFLQETGRFTPPQILYFPINDVCEFQLLHNPTSSFDFLFFFLTLISGRYIVASHGDYNLHFPSNEWFQHFFHVIIDHLHIFLFPFCSFFFYRVNNFLIKWKNYLYIIGSQPVRYIYEHIF